jgi:threonine aldolase
MEIINLISDTVTKPSSEMLAAMMSAEVGDDVFGEDPTVNALESKAAKLFEKDAALFCPSGTMTNQIAIKVHTKPLDEVICDHYSHIFQYEVGGYAYHSGVAINPLIGEYGKITAHQIKEAIKPKYDWLPRTRLVVLENSTNKGGGNYYTIPELEPIKTVCDESGLALHLDGARLHNVLVETGETTAQVGKVFDSISLCLSKGLGCPVGSLLIGNKDFIAEARRVRKAFGGGMRQAGILAAAGIYALDNHVDQLKVDNARAKEIGDILINCKYVDHVLPVKTNIVIFAIQSNISPSQFIAQLKDKGILCTHFGGQYIRFVFHRDVSVEMMETFKKKLNSI